MNIYLMNPHTGTVQTVEEWEADGYTEENADLVEVIKDSQNNWIEKDKELIMNTINLNTQSDNTTSWYIDVYGDLFKEKNDAEVSGIDKIIVTDGWFPGTFEDWKKNIMGQLSDKLRTK